MDGTAAADAMRALSAAVDALLEVDLSGFDAAEFAGLMAAFETQRQRLDAVDVRVLAQADEQLVAEFHCRSSTADLLVHQLRCSPGEARARVRRARDLGPRRTLQGEPLEPIHPLLAAAQQAGQISSEQLDVATKTLGRVGAVEALGVVETFLVQAAAHENPKQLAVSGEMLLERLDPDGCEPDDERVHARRGFGLHRKPDGSWTAAGTLTDETGLVWQTILDTLSAPAPAAPPDGESGECDPRTPDQRRHDAVRDLGLRLLRSGVPTESGNAAVTILLRARPEDLTDAAGVVQSEHGHPTRIGSLRFLLGDTEIVPLLFDRARSDCQLMLGRTQRFANRAQRRALAGRDGGCSFPGCTRPASWCEAHHVLEWILGGLTDIDNLTLLCGFHHREFGRRGWRVQMSEGLPHWIPPRWLDPDQTPRVNTAHHLPEIVFDPDGAIATVRRP